MPNTHSTLTSLFSDIANAIRAKKGTSADIVADNFPSEIASIPSGGITPSGNINITENGTYDVTEYAEAVVDVSGGGAEITDGIVVTARNANGYATEAKLYCGDVVYPKQFYQGYAGGSWNTDTNGVWQAMQTLTVVGKPKNLKLSAFSHMKGDITADFSEVTRIGENPKSGNYDASCFNGSGIKNISLDSLTYLAGYTFAGCTSLKTVYLPCVTDISNKWDAAVQVGRATFDRCTALETVQIGSVGHSVTSLSDQAFNGCTQSGLAVTVYTTAALADTIVAHIRNKATNATIIIKASEATTYNGTAYAAGETMITSEVA